MARRRRYGYGTPNYSAPAAIAVKPIVIDVDGLGRAYDWMGVSPALALRLAGEWYEKNSVDLLMKHPLTADQQRSYDKGVKALALGLNVSNSEHELNQALTTAFHTFERVWPTAGLPLVDQAPAAPAGDAARVLANLNAVFSGIGVEYAPVAGTERALEPGRVAVPVAMLEAWTAEPSLKLALCEATNAAKAASLIPFEGKYKLDGPLLIANLPLVLDGVYEWATKLGNITKPVAKVTPSKHSGGFTGQPRATGMRVIGRRFGDAMVIRTLQTHSQKGRAKCIFDLLRDGMTVAQFRIEWKALPANVLFHRAATTDLNTAIKKGWVSVL